MLQQTALPNEPPKKTSAGTLSVVTQRVTTKNLLSKTNSNTAPPISASTDDDTNSPSSPQDNNATNTT